MKNVRVNDYVSFEAATLAVGESIRGKCPVCHGGPSQEVSFTITRDSHGVLYNCYRASCPFRGYLPTSGRLIQVEPKEKTLKPYFGEYRSLSDGEKEFLSQRFGLASWPPYAIGINENEKFVFEVRDPNGYGRGYLVRECTWGLPCDRAKTRLWMHTDGPSQSVYRADDFAIVLVEDVVSALKVWQTGHTSVALLGTTLNEEKVREIAQLRPEEVVIALDKDATQQSFKHARKWGLAWNRVRVAMLDKDLKDQRGDLEEILGL